MALLSVQIGTVAALQPAGVFECLATQEQRTAASECVVRQLFEAPAAPLLPYDTDPLIIIVEALVTSDGEVFETNVNHPVEWVLWTDCQGNKYRCAVADLQEV